MPADPELPKELLFEALQLEPEERTTFLDEACGDDTTLRGKVDALLSAHGEASRLLGPTELAGRTPDALSGSFFKELGPGDRIGHYVLGELLGEGGFGKVFTAEQELPVRRRVALKIVKAGFGSEQILARFAAERQALAVMDHPNIARVFDAGTTESGRPFFVMEHVDGVSITEYCEERGLDTLDRLELVRTTCLALQHAHGKGILHRDIKPTNVLVTEVDGRPVPKIIDFGIAKSMDSEALDHGVRTREGSLVGTPLYMSPEQLQGLADIDIRADVYALGVLLYELVCGVPPFDADALREQGGMTGFKKLVCEVDPAPPGARLKQLRAIGDSTRTASQARIPDELDWIVMRCLEKERERRYPTAQALAEDILRHLVHEPIEAAPPSATYRLRKLVRRYRVAATTCVIVLLALVLGIIGTSIGLARAEQANLDLDRALQRVLAVNAFLTVDLLSAVQPSGEVGEGRDVLMIDVLDAAASRIDEAAMPGGRFADAPMVEASIRFTLGETYSSLGRQDDALAHLDRSLALHRQHVGPRDPATLRCAVERAEALANLGRFDEAHGAVEQILPDLTAALDPTDSTRLHAAGIQGQALWRLGHHDEAADLMQRRLEEAGQLLDHPAHRSLLDLMSSLAIVELERGRPDAAGQLFETVAERRVALHGEEDPRALTARRHLGTYLRQSGQLDDAREILEQTLALERRIMGPDHPNTIASMENLAGVLLLMGDLDRAEELLEEVASFFETGFTDHPSAVVALSSLAQLRHQQGRMDEAEDLFRRAHEVSVRQQGPDHPFTLQHLGNLGALLQYTGHPEEALPLYERIHADALERFGPRSVARLAELRRVSRCKQDLMRLDEAEAHLLEGLEAAADLPDHQSVVLAMRADLYGVYHSQRRWEEAEPVIAALYATYVEREDPRVAATGVLLSKLYDRIGRPEDAARIRAAADGRP